MPLAGSATGPVQFVRVLRTEEKGSDVNLATWLLVDAFEHDFEMAAVISNDSDLAEPIRVVITRLGLPVRVYNPQAMHHASSELTSVATLCRSIKQDALAKCQFPNTLTDASGSFTKPREW